MCARDYKLFESRSSVFIIGNWNARVGNGSKADYIKKVFDG